MYFVTLLIDSGQTPVKLLNYIVMMNIHSDCPLLVETHLLHLDFALGCWWCKSYPVHSNLPLVPLANMCWGFGGQIAGRVQFCSLFLRALVWEWCKLLPVSSGGSLIQMRECLPAWSTESLRPGAEVYFWNGFNKWVTWYCGAALSSFCPPKLLLTW